MVSCHDDGAGRRTRALDSRRGILFWDILIGIAVDGGVVGRGQRSGNF